MILWESMMVYFCFKKEFISLIFNRILCILEYIYDIYMIITMI